jgi:hypothetical protein
MTSLSTAEDPRDAAHRRVQELLPWYTSGTLDAREADEVARHLAACPICARAAANARTLASALSDRSEDAWSLPADHFERMRARLAAAPDTGGATGPLLAAAAPHPAARARPPVRTGPARGVADALGALRRAWEWLRVSPAPLRAALAVQLLLIAGLGAALVAVQRDASQPAAGEYGTLTRPAPRLPAVGGELGIRIVFAPEITEAELRALLRSENATFGGGPSSVGAYTLRVPGEAQRDRLLARLRAHPRVQLAEPLALAGRP